ncbi:MAG: hypothetical protein JWQ25_708 [Daejeonella sp.]|nr:hypothetical protein [Daejeonella sp.]
MIFIDSDILLDVALNRQPHEKYAMQLLTLRDTHNATLCTSASSLLNVHYFAYKAAGKTQAKHLITILKDKIAILSTDIHAINSALSSDFEDFEDAVQYHTALSNNAKIIITRNLKDYKKSAIPFMTADQYMKTL